MKSKFSGIAALCLATATAIGQEPQQQSPFQTPVPVPVPPPATVESRVILNLSGVTVADQTGQPLGPIQHILLSPAGCIDLAVLSLGGQKLVPIPWRMVTGTGATRGETEIASQVALAVRVDRNTLMQAPTVTVAQLNQPQIIQQVHAYFGPAQQQTNAAAGGTGSQTNITAGVSVTNHVNVGITNRTAIPSPTGPTNVLPGRPAFETNAARTPSINPQTPNTNRVPLLNRRQTNAPPVGAPRQPGQP